MCIGKIKIAFKSKICKWHHSNGQQGAEFRGIEFYMDTNHITSGNVIQIT